MTEREEKVVEKMVDEQLIAGIRFLGSAGDIPKAFRELDELAGDVIMGKAMIHYYWGHAGPEQDIEVCYQVSSPVECNEVHSRNLPGGRVLSIIHRGSYKSMVDSWRKLYHRMQSHRLGWGNGPSREIYLEGLAEHGDKEEYYVTELQIPLLLPEWIGNLANGVKRYAGMESMHYILDGSQGLNSRSTARQRAIWMQGMVERLEEMVPAEDERHAILSGCSHVFPERRVAQLRELYEQTGNLDTVIAFMNEDQSEDGASYYEWPLRDNDVIRVTKIPYDAKGFEKAQTSLEKRMAYCHCPMLKDAFEEGIQISSTYCHCGAGWYHYLWEGILGEPVKVNIVQTLLKGDDVCEFTIHLAP